MAGIPLLWKEFTVYSHPGLKPHIGISANLLKVIGEREKTTCQGANIEHGVQH